jgi:hypothetical protein
MGGGTYPVRAFDEIKYAKSLCIFLKCVIMVQNCVREIKSVNSYRRIVASQLVNKYDVVGRCVLCQNRNNRLAQLVQCTSQLK